MAAKPVEAPRFLFERRPDVEAAHGWLLAGWLTVDVPAAPLPPAERHQDMINDIVAALIAAAKADAMPADGLTLSWPGDEDELAAWRERSLTLRLCASQDGGGHVSVKIKTTAEDEDKPVTLH